jgi:hypothetical protein
MIKEVMEVIHMFKVGMLSLLLVLCAAGVSTMVSGQQLTSAPHFASVPPFLGGPAGQKTK